MREPGEGMVTAALKVGLLGAGYILDSHAAALAGTSGVTVYAVCDTSRGRAVNAARKHGIAHIFTSIDELVRSDCDVVHVLLPPALHLEAATALVEAGKSVFLEKPMGLDSGACAALCARAAVKGVAVGVNHNFLFSRGYESLRATVQSGELGRIDHLDVNWHFALPILQFGPFDTWMLAAPANLMFETGPHLAAFVVDLLGPATVLAAVAENPIVLPPEQTVYRKWSVIARAGAASVTLAISHTGGHADRRLRVRCRGGSVSLDFGRDISWLESSANDNPIFDAYEAAKSAGRALTHIARRDRVRRLRAALAKRAGANPFEESIFLSIRAFYAGGLPRTDWRHDGRFGVEVIRLCEAVTAAAKVGAPSRASVSVSLPQPQTKPTVLVVGGTGFIGRRLVRRLAKQGHAVRVMTRNVRAAAIELGDSPVELFSGSHGDPESAKRALEGIEVVYHLAKCEGKRWQDYVEGDIEPTRVLAEAALAGGVRRFIYTGTIASYASDKRTDLIDNHTPVDAAITRRDHYARSKAACEALLQDLQRNRGLPLVILRPGIVIGPGSPPSHLGVAQFTTETQVDFWGDGDSPLPLVLVDDVADALVRALDAPGIVGQTLLVTGPPLLTAREYVNAVAAHTSTRIAARPRPAWRYWLADLVKELAKNVVQHPNRRWPSLHDWRCRSNCARFDGGMTEQALDWHPVSDRQTVVARGINEAIDWYLR